MFTGSSTFRKQCFLVCQPSGNMVEKQCFLVCQPLGNMARKQCFLVYLPSGNMARKQSNNIDVPMLPQINYVFLQAKDDVPKQISQVLILS